MNGGDGMERYKTFNLTEGFPNVLLLGNGILRSCKVKDDKELKSWGKYIKELSEQTLSKKKANQLNGLPYSLQASIITAVDDSKRQGKYADIFVTAEFEDDSLLKNLLEIGFDSIITTNYTYEIEDAFHGGYSKLKDKLTYAKSTERDSRFLLHTYNQFDNKVPIWHIHGELRRKSSIILTHDEYARLISHLIKENELNQDKYEKYNKEVKYKSWLDYFLMSNLYIVGLGMDFSEFDLWWILNRRMREKASVGKIIFFKSEDDSYNVCNALKAMNVNVISFDIDVDEKDYYNEFYKKVTEFIKKDINSSKGVKKNEKGF